MNGFADHAPGLLVEQDAAEILAGIPNLHHDTFQRGLIEVFPYEAVQREVPVGRHPQLHQTFRPHDRWRSKGAGEAEDEGAAAYHLV